MAQRRVGVEWGLRTGCGAFLSLLALSAAAQYPGQVARSAKDAPELRSIAVLEWTGEPGRPTASRLVPVAVLAEGELLDGSIYLARPQPLALSSEVEYELQQNGQPIGFFDVKNAGREQGAWVGFGSWRPLPVARPRPATVAKIDEDQASDQPVLHRKHHSDDRTSAKTSGGSGSGNGSASQDPPSDPDRPVLHKKDAGGDSNSSSRPSSDPDASTSSAPPSDPDRPVLHKPKPKPVEQPELADSSVAASDPDRPQLKRGKSSGDGAELAPNLVGLPAEFAQTVAVSDARSRPAHPWSFSWSDPADEEKMKAALEDLARTALGANPPPAAPKARRAVSHKKTIPVPAPPPAALEDEQFRVFELAYGSGATLVLSARGESGSPSGNEPAVQAKFVTLIAQPDLYGGIQVLLKSVTDSAHLDDAPRMRLIDAVDAMADNRGELLFELRGKSGRQFALYRVLRGQAEKVFVGGGSIAGAGDSE